MLLLPPPHPSVGILISFCGSFQVLSLLRVWIPMCALRHTDQYTGVGRRLLVPKGAELSAQFYSLIFKYFHVNVYINFIFFNFFI